MVNRMHGIKTCVKLTKAIRAGSFFCMMLGGETYLRKAECSLELLRSGFKYSFSSFRIPVTILSQYSITMRYIPACMPQSMCMWASYTVAFVVTAI